MKVFEIIAGCALMSAFVMGMGFLVMVEGWGVPW